jgi:hypothetical protein
VRPSTPVGAVLATLAVLGASASAQVFNPATGHIYVLTPPASTFTAARTAATAAGGYLVAINDAAENAFLQANFTGRLWIGLTDEVTEGTFLWDSGEPLIYTNWCAGEPNNVGTLGEDYVEFLSAQGCWNDQPVGGNGLVPRGVIELPFGPRFQLNQPQISADFDGVQATVLTPALSTACPGQMLTANVASPLLGSPFDVAAAFSPAVPAGSLGSITTAGGQIVNVDLTQPLLFIFGGTAPLSTPFPGAFFVPITAPNPPFALAAQAIIADPTHPDLFRLSQAASISVTTGGSSAPGPAGDDVSVSLNVTSPPLCAPQLPFYGTSYTTLHVASNGRALFVGQDNDFTPTVAEALLDNPFAGAWTDLNPGVGGTVTVVSTGTGIRIDYTAVPYFGSTVLNTFSIEFDASSAEVKLLGINGIGAGGAMFLGISRGNTGATNAGAAMFANLVGFTANATDMIYEFGSGGTLAPGITNIRFIPNGSGNYDFIAN